MARSFVLLYSVENKESAFLMKAARSAPVSLFAALLAALAVLPSPTAAGAAPGTAVKYSLRSNAADRMAVDVRLTFNMKTGQKAVLAPSGVSPGRPVSGPPPALELTGPAEPGYEVQSLQGPGNGWEVTSGGNGRVVVEYRVSFTTGDPGALSTHGAAAGGALPPRAITNHDLKAFSASDVLLVPQDASGDYLDGGYSVAIDCAAGESVLAPWSGEAGRYTVGTTDELLTNFIAWGKMDVVELRNKGPRITAGFSGLSSKRLPSFREGLSGLRDEVVRVLGARPDEEAAAVLVVRSAESGPARPESLSFRDSFLLFTRGTEMQGGTAAAAARGWLGLWNGRSLAAKPSSGAEWLERGLPWFYGYRVAGKTGLLDANDAYGDFSRVYSEYLTDPLAVTTSLQDAESDPAAANLLATKGACVLASLAVRLRGQAPGGAKDLEWFLGRLADRFDGMKGRRYSQVDVSEVLEDGTGKSWDRFFSGRVTGRQVLKASEWSSTDVFGERGVVGGASPRRAEGSGRNWILLAVAVLVIFSIPFVFSGYIKRSIKLDVSVPRILPDWDEEPEGPGEKDRGDPAHPIDAGNPAGEAVTEIDRPGEGPPL